MFGGEQDRSSGPKRGAWCCALLLAIAGGGGLVPVSAQEPALTPGVSALPETFEFVVAPLTLDHIQWMTPLGNLNPPQHTFPTDHIYFFHHVGRESDPPFEVFAPASGVVTSVDRGADDAIRIAASATQTYYIGHILLDPAIVPDQPIAAGQRLGTTGPVSHAIDLGVMNSSVLNAFVNPDRYSTNSRQGEPPFRFFSEAFKAQLGPLVQTTSGNLEGQFMCDIPGTLAGNWFHETLPIWESSGPVGGARHVAFVPDSRDPSRRVVSLGGTVGIAGIYVMEPSDPDPAAVTADTGGVTFHLSNMQQGTTNVPMAVTVLSDTSIRIRFQDHEEVYTR